MFLSLALYRNPLANSEPPKTRNKCRPECLPHLGRLVLKQTGQDGLDNQMDEAALEGVQAFIDKRPPRWPKNKAL